MTTETIAAMRARLQASEPLTLYSQRTGNALGEYTRDMLTLLDMIEACYTRTNENPPVPSARTGDCLPDRGGTGGRDN